MKIIPPDIFSVTDIAEVIPNHVFISMSIIRVLDFFPMVQKEIPKFSSICPSKPCSVAPIAKILD